MIHYTTRTCRQYDLYDVLLTVDYDDSNEVRYVLEGVTRGVFIPEVVSLEVFKDLQDAIYAHKTLKASIENERKSILSDFSFENLLSDLPFPEVEHA